MRAARPLGGAYKVTVMDPENERHLLEILRHLNAGENMVFGLSAIADHWRGDSSSFRRTLDGLVAKEVIEIRDEGYCLTQAGKAAIS